MKRLIEKLFFVLLITSCVSPKQQELVFTSVAGDAWVMLGQINEADGVISMKVLIPNTSEDTLRAKKTASSCSCFTLEKFETISAAPGEDIVALMTYDPAYRKDAQKETVRVLLSDKSIVDIHLRADVIPCKHPIEEDHPYDFGESLHSSHGSLSYGYMEPGETRDMYIHIACGKDKPSEVFLEPQGENSDCIRFRQLGRVEADSRDTLHFKLTMPQMAQPYDTVRFVIQPYVDGVPTERSFKVRAVCK